MRARGHVHVHLCLEPLPLHVLTALGSSCHSVSEAQDVLGAVLHTSLSDFLVDPFLMMSVDIIYHRFLGSRFRQKTIHLFTFVCFVCPFNSINTKLYLKQPFINQNITHMP